MMTFPGRHAAPRIVRRRRTLTAPPGPPRMERKTRRVIDLRGATKTFDTGAVQVHALRGITVAIERGD
jgi:hypothetical protein